MTHHHGNGGHSAGDVSTPQRARPGGRGGLRLVAVDGRLTQAAHSPDIPSGDAGMRALPFGRWAQAALGSAQAAQAAARVGHRPAEVAPGVAVHDGLVALLEQLDRAPAATNRQLPRGDAALAALNGLLGDHLQRCGHPLAMTAQLRWHVAPIDLQAPGHRAGDPAIGLVPDQLLLLVHDLCQSDLGWQRDGHDHGQQLARALGAAAVYARYNSGLAIGDNGLALARLIEPVVARWPVPLRRLVVIGHGMGGLVARSACAQAQALGMGWPARLRQMVFLGVPHQGLPQAGAGHWLHRVMAIGPRSAPFDSLSRLCSAGLADLRQGRLLDSAGQAACRAGAGEPRLSAAPLPVALPAGVGCFAIAGTAGGRGHAGSMRSDGLVPVASALGRHRRAAQRLALDEAHCWVGHGLRHLELLSDPAVCRRMLGWLQPG